MNGQNQVVVGLQWGDEGKGKIVDLLARSADMVVRFQGGNNAGHTLVVDGQKVVLHLVPSGILHPGVRCLIGGGVVLDPEVFCQELAALQARGVDVSPGRLLISGSAHTILPVHRLLDHHREEARGANRIGTTGRGIGPTYEDKVARRGLRLSELIDPTLRRARLADLLVDKNRQLVEWYGASPVTVEDVEQWAAPLAETLAPYVTDTVEVLHQAIDDGRRILFEGAQGTFLDIDHGTYPFVTSSNTLSGGACAGAGVGPRDLHHIIGVTKAYITRVGAGPFPTALDGDEAEHMRQLGGEFGATTGRPRRCGWFDAPLLRRAIRLNSVTNLVLTKLDILSSYAEIPICVAYDTTSGNAQPDPIYETLPGWQTDIQHARTWDDLPPACQRYVTRIEELVGIPVSLVSVGPGRTEVIARNDIFENKVC